LGNNPSDNRQKVLPILEQNHPISWKFSGGNRTFDITTKWINLAAKGNRKFFKNAMMIFSDGANLLWMAPSSWLPVSDVVLTGAAL